MIAKASPAEKFDVAIIGYGPTGLALAYWLGKAGHKTVVIERWPNLYDLPRAGHVDGEVMRLFQRMGAAQAIARDSSVTRRTVIRDSEGVHIMEIPVEESDQGWHSHYSLFQPNLERVLDARVRDTGNVTVRQGWQGERIDREDDGSFRISITSGCGIDGNWQASGDTGIVCAKWLIGADGANSVVQKFMQVPVEDLGYKSRALVVFAERLEPSVGAQMPDCEVGMIPRRPYIALRESGKRFARWEFHVHDHENSAEMGSEPKAWELIEAWGFTPANSRLVRHSVFEFRTLVAENWRDGRVMLAGDAAHRMPPFQGQGMCSGQRDAAALAWRLDLVLRGAANEGLLNSYTAERKPHVVELMKNSVERGRQFWLTDAEQARERDVRMRMGIVASNLKKGHGSVPSLSQGMLMSGPNGPSAPAGELSRQFHLRYEGRRSLLDDLVGANWLLIACDRSDLDALRASDQKLLERLSAVTVLLHGDKFEDVDENYGRWLRDLGLRLVLIRPDSYIFGGACNADGAYALFDSLSAQLHLAAELL